MEEKRQWTARWIGAGLDGASGETAKSERRQHRTLFRKTFDVPEPADARLSVDVSADSKYRLYLNGELVSRGPCKGDDWNRYYDTVDLGAGLIAGRNVLAAEIVHYPILLTGGESEGGPLSEWRSDAGALWLEGSLIGADGDVLTVLDTDASWRLRRMDAVSIGKEKGTLFVGGTEQVRGDLIPEGWRLPGFDDSDWERCANPVEPLDRLYGQIGNWPLKPRPLPPLRETMRDFVSVVRSSRTAELADGSLFPLAVSPGETVWLELDAGEMTTGYPWLEVEGGAGGRVSMLYSEAYEYVRPEEHGGRRRVVRHDPTDKALFGNEDVYEPAGIGRPGRPESYEPMGRRAFRFVRLTVRAGEQGLTIARLRYRETGYPLDPIASFRSSDPECEPMWRISLNTLRRCMQDTYEDTPYYEQMQYVMDAKSQALFTYALSADDRLARKTLYDFHSSLTPTGLVQSRYPSVSRQIIPGFALFWIMMVHDHYRHFGDAGLVRRYLATADAILGWFDRLIEGGLVGYIPEPYWAFVDWVEEWRKTEGAPPARLVGPLTVYNLMYAESLRQAAELNEAIGRRDTAAEYRVRAEAIVASVRASCYDETSGLFADGPGLSQFSQHAQIWAVLAGAVAGDEARMLMERMLARTDLPRASFSMAHYLFRALAATGLYERIADLWQPWKDQIPLGLTAWVEDPVNNRSDCHGWGALPLYEYTAETLGVKPERPGYEAIRIAPRLSGLQWAAGTVATPKGAVRVEWRREPDGTFALRAETPPGVPVIVTLPDGSRHESDAASIRLACKIVE